ncbi:MAG: MBOAT family protein, partial [Clostridia bacterium]|nr:MBOAT family protein [Clostridia bacterium]
VVTYVAGFIMNKFYEIQDKKCEGLDRKEKKPIKAEYNKKRKVVLIVSIITVILGLVVIKYVPFLTGVFNGIIGWFGLEAVGQDSFGEFAVNVLGSSYFTLSIIAYLTDVYRGKFKAEKNPLKLYVFVSFFPHIKIGPIERYNELAPQLFQGNKFEFTNIKQGAMMFMYGIFKQLVITNRLSTVTAYIFDNYKELNAITILFGTVVFSIQIYTDWTAYCDIVGGVAKMLGINITKNFEQPYFSKSMPEFWRRWHMSMGKFFKDYVLYPISASNFCLKLNKNSRKIFGNTAGRVISSALPILAVWALTGLWHGANYNFLCWGAFQGLLIMLSVIFTPGLQKLNEKLHFKTETFGWSLFRMGRTFLLCCMGRIFFRTSSVADAFGMFSRLTVFEGGFPLSSFGLAKREWLIIAIALAVVLLVSILEENKVKVFERLDKQPIIFKWLILFAVIMFIVVFGVYGSDAPHVNFIYEQF